MMAHMTHGRNKEVNNMKKKFLLMIIPALMALSSCAGAGPKEEIKQEPEMVEDTLAHEEIFGGVAEIVDNMKALAPRKLANPLTKPVTGVQYKDQGDGTYAIRYVAAIADLGVEAVWTRGVCLPTGSQHKTFAEKECDAAYTALSSGTSVEVPSLAGEDFNYFVVYTLRNIPEEQLDSYLFAYLTIKKGESEVKSLARISRLGEGKTFTYDTENDPKYFIQGTFDGIDGIKPVNDTPADTNWAQEEDIGLKANDSFGLFKYEKTLSEELFQCFGYNQLRRGAQFFGTGDYNLYLTKSNQIHIAAPDTAKTSAKLYFKPGNDWTSYPARYALYVFNDDKGTNDWFDLTQIGSTGIYSCTEFSAVTWPNCIFCRMDKNAAANTWSNKWSQTGNLNTDDAGNIYYVNDDSGTGDGCLGNWNLYLTA